jgi:lysophospholipase L1-like esterase
MNICIFGDSIAWGASDPKGGGWVGRLQNYFLSQGLAVDNDIDVYNLGVSGDNTDDLIKRFDVEAKARDPHVIIFAIGINDSQIVISKNQNRVPIKQFQNNLETLILEAKKYTNKIIFIGLTPIDESKTSPIPWNIDKRYSHEEIEKYNSIIKTTALKENLLYISVKEKLSARDLPDGLHPNSEGHTKLFEIIKHEIEKTISH